MTTAASHSGDGVSIAHGLVLTVLVVDDEIDARGIVKGLLEMNGTTVSMAEDRSHSFSFSESSCEARRTGRVAGCSKQRGRPQGHKSVVSPGDSREAAPPH